MPQVLWIIERFPTKKRHRETKKLDKIVRPFVQRLFDTRPFLKQKGPPTKLFGTVRHKKSTENRANPPPPPLWPIIVISPWCKKSFVTGNFVIQRRVPYEIFRKMRQTFIRRRILISPYPLMHKQFRYPKSFQTPKRSPTNFFDFVRLKFINGKSWNSPIIHKIFGRPNFCESLKGSPENFRHCETQTINRFVIPLLSKTFDTRTNLKHRVFAHDAFQRCETKKNNKIVIPLLSKRFLIPERFWNTERFAHDVFRRFGTNIFRRKNVTPPFLSIYFFHTRKFLKHKSVPPRTISVLWD